MIDTPQEPDDRSNDPIELEPAIEPTMPRYIVSSASERSKATDTGAAVPDSPLHLCPKCEYDLRGLLSRKCPECGTPFTLAGARRVGLQYLPETKTDLTVAQQEQTRQRIGLALFACALIVPFILSPTNWQLFFSMIRIVIILMFATMYKIWSQQAWHKIIFVAGIIAATIEGLLALI